MDAPYLSPYSSGKVRPGPPKYREASGQYLGFAAARISQRLHLLHRGATSTHAFSGGLCSSLFRTLYPLPSRRARASNAPKPCGLSGFRLRCLAFVQKSAISVTYPQPIPLRNKALQTPAASSILTSTHSHLKALCSAAEHHLLHFILLNSISRTNQVGAGVWVGITSFPAVLQHKVSGH